ncbi:MAG: S8 family serine peptidase [Aphanizomenon sp.]
MNKNWLIFWSLGFSCLTLPVFAGNKLANFLDTNGIDALKLHQAPYNLTGRKIAIGQVEIGRPGMFGWDKAVSKNRSVSPLAVFLRNAPAKSNIGVDPHAYNVSGVMVSQDKAFPGVAPNARLYSSAVGSVKKIGQPEECLSAQHIALQNGGDVRAINFSFGEPLDRDPRPEAILDGNALLTLCIDWSSSVHDVVYSIAGNQGKGGIPIPTDNFNAINVAFSSEQKGIFNKVHVSNLTSANQAIENRLAGKEFNLAGRSAISLVAPGTNLPLLNPDGKLNKSTGTSFAAPQVTATVALLQEFVDKQLRSKQPNWTINARRHQVMKAILLNSADKIKDSGDGLRLGMTRTLIEKQNLDWLATAAYKNAKIPLDAQMGAGHLNAFRAYQQLNGGEWKPTLTVPPIGWDYGIINTNSSQEYALEKSLKKNSFVAITLSWDRLVELNDKNNNQQYDLDETFVNKGLNDLDVYLVQENGKNDQVVVCASMSELDSIEHIFCPVPTHGNYKIRVQFKKQINKPTQSYALAWWTVPER